MLKRILLSAALVLGTGFAVQAQTVSAVAVNSCGTPPVTYTAGKPYPVTQTTGGQSCVNSTAGQSGNWNVGGYEFNTSVIPTVQNAAYAAGQSLGGLQTISIGSTNGLTGILDQIQIASNGGSTVAVVIYVWDKNPAATTCTDKSNFVGSQTDNEHLVGNPVLLTPALSVSAQDTSTRAQASNLTDNFVNSSSNTDLYICILANAAVTPATTSDYRLNIQGIKDQP